MPVPRKNLLRRMDQSVELHGIKSAWVKEQHAVIENGKVVVYRVD